MESRDMARKKGRDISGWLVVDKPAGVTSTAVVNKVRWAFDAQEGGPCGHAGPGCDRRAGRGAGRGDEDRALHHRRAEMLPLRGAVRGGDEDRRCRGRGDRDLRGCGPPMPRSTLRLPAFRGDIMQVPPQFSAVKVDGERAYELARAGEEMELGRATAVGREPGDDLRGPTPITVELEMVCGKGGYVRSIARDLGAGAGLSRPCRSGCAANGRGRSRPRTG